MKSLRLLSFLIYVCLLVVPGMSADKGPILVLSIEGVINPVVSDYVKGALKKAEEQNASAVLIELNTPGGLLDATRSSIEAMINSPLPVIVYVSPRGARATSAGVFITMASDVAAMSPETHIGAAHPVTVMGEAPQEPTQKMPDLNKKSDRPSVMEEKMVSDAAAYIRTLAKDRGRNAAWAEQAVRQSVSLTSEEALKKNVIELMADSRDDLLKAIDGREITKNKKTIRLNLKGAAVVLFPMTTGQKFLQMLGHPNVAYILMMIGFYGIIYEFAHPGIGMGGAVGAVCLLLAFYSLQVLPINVVGLILIVFGLGCLLMEVLTPTHGLLTVNGLIAFGVGSFMLIDVPQDLSIKRVSLSLILPTVLTTGAFFTLAIKKAFEARRMKPQTGVESLTGSVGEVRHDFAPDGMVFLKGELWAADGDTDLRIGDKVIVTGHQGNKLKVKKVSK